MLMPGLRYRRMRYVTESAAAVTYDIDKSERGFKDHEYFVREFFEHHFWGEMSDMHRDFCELEGDPARRGFKEAIAAPRGNAKTTFRVLIKAVHAIVYGYHPFIVVLGYSQKEAIDKLKDIRRELITNERLIETFGKLASPKAGEKDFTTVNGVRLVARSRGGQIRGLKHGQHRPSLIICDDIESIESVATPEQRMKTKQWFFKDVMGAGSADGSTDVEVVGTILHEESLLSDLLKTPGWHRKKYQAIKSWPENQPLWDQWQAIYTNLDNQNAKEDARAFYDDNEVAMLAGVEILWPSGEPFYNLMEYRIQYGLASLHSEKQNEPFDPETQILKPELCFRFKTFRPRDPEWPDDLGREGFAVVRENDGRAVRSQDMRIIAFMDPALGRKQKNGGQARGDYAAIVVCGQDMSGYIYVLDVWMKRLPPNDQIRQAFILHERWGFEALYLETIGFQELLRIPFADEQKRWQNQMRIIGVDQHNEGKARITMLEPYFTNRWIYFPDVIDHEFMNQIRLFPTAHDDGPDALHGCVSRLRRPQGGIISSGNDKKGTV